MRTLDPSKLPTPAADAIERVIANLTAEPAATQFELKHLLGCLDTGPAATLEALETPDWLIDLFEGNEDETVARRGHDPLVAGTARLLSPAARQAINEPGIETFVSIASIREISIKIGTGKLKLAIGIPRLIALLEGPSNVKILNVERDAVVRLLGLPPVHRDPFDRIRVCQAQTLDLTIVTPDPLIALNPVSTLW